jgi:hypothetical protein
MERVGRVQYDRGSTDDGLQRRLHHGDDGLRVVATVGEAIRRPSDRDNFGQRTVSALQAGRGVGEGVGHHIAVFAERLAEPEFDRTALEVCEKKCLSNVYYETFADFTSGINDCLNRVEADYKTELETLMQPNFQNLKNTNVLAL